MRKINIFLRANSSLADWLISDEQGQTLQAVTQGELSQIEHHDEDEITVILPGQEILLTLTKMPKLNAFRLQQALPFALEEQVLDEMDELHFANGPYLSDNAEEPNLPVAIIKKSLLENHLDALKQAGIQANHILPEFFTLPYQDKQWQLIISGDQVTIRTGLYSGFSLDLPNLETLLDLKLAETDCKPEKLVIYHDKAHALPFKHLSLPIEEQSLAADKLLALQAATLAHFPSLDLLQGNYHTTRKIKMTPKNKKAWRLAAYAVALWIGVALVSKLGSIFILSIEHHHLQSKIAQIYQVHFPQAKVVTDPRTRFEAKLKRALAESEKNALFQWLGYIGKQSSSIRIQSLSYQNKQLSLELMASSFSSLDDFIMNLKSNGIEVKQQNAALLGNQVKALVLIEGKRS